jgi:carbon-monoxide dehydrogenase small subunit
VPARVPVTLTLNGQEAAGLVEPRTTLADFVREQGGLTGTHLACWHGVCGACTVAVDGRPVRGCLMLAVQADGAAVTTVEGLAPSPTELHPLQEAFREAHGLQCGFCTPGMLVTAAALLEHDPDPDEATIRDFMHGNLCRCTGYEQIVEAIQLAARRLGEGGAHA